MVCVNDKMVLIWLCSINVFITYAVHADYKDDAYKKLEILEEHNEKIEELDARIQQVQERMQNISKSYKSKINKKLKDIDASYKKISEKIEHLSSKEKSLKKQLKVSNSSKDKLNSSK